MRGVGGSATVPLESRCSRCRFRWKQHTDGLCRACHRAGQMPDPVREAINILRKNLARQYVFTPKDDAHRLEVFRLVGKAEHALDLLAERLRGVS